VHGQRGITLTELLVVLAIVAVLTGLLLPGSATLVGETRDETTMRGVLAAINYARTVALTTGEPAVLCALDDGGRCDGAWSAGFSVFADRDADARLDADERVYRKIDAVRDGARLALRAFRTGRYLRLLPNGQTGWRTASRWNPTAARCRAADARCKMRNAVRSAQLAPGPPPGARPATGVGLADVDRAGRELGEALGAEAGAVGRHSLMEAYPADGGAVEPATQRRPAAQVDPVDLIEQRALVAEAQRRLHLADADPGGRVARRRGGSATRPARS